MSKIEFYMNIAFIDGQNLYINTRAYGWSINLAKFRIYLRDKYNVREAYYFIGAINNENQRLYASIRIAGFKLVFREHNQSMVGKKKGNVDTDIVFMVMEMLAERREPFKIVLVSGYGDYIRMVKYLIKKDRLAKVLAPNKKSVSSLYHQIDNSYLAILDSPNTKEKIQKI